MNSILKVLEAGGTGRGADAMAIESLDAAGGTTMTLLSTGRNLAGVEKSWDFVDKKAPNIRRGLILAGERKELDEFDRKVCAIRMELRNAGVPRQSEQLN